MLNFLEELTPAICQPALTTVVLYAVRAFRGGCEGGSVGSYSDSPRLEVVRRHVTKYIMECGEEYYSFVGASKGIRGYPKLRTGPDTEIKPGVIPFPHFPLYSATFAEDIMEQDKYYLNESGSCVMVVAELERSYQATKDTPDTEDIVAINPCDPTGQVHPGGTIAIKR